MDEKQVKETIDNVDGFKNTTVNFNNDKEICDIYTRCLLPQDEFLEKIKKVKQIEVVPCNFGIFELIILIKDLEKTLKKFVKVFSEE